MIAARSGRSDIADILLEGEHIDLDIQEIVGVYILCMSVAFHLCSPLVYYVKPH